MRAIDLDFARRPALPRGVGAALLAAGVGVLAAALLHTASLRTQLDQLDSELDTAQRALRHERLPLKPPAGGPESENLVQELTRANRVIASLNLGWGALFKQLESIQVRGVTLLSVQPEAGSARRLRLTGQAPQLEDALDYVKRVADAQGFSKAHLVSHEQVQDGARSAVRFAFVVEWVAQP